MVLPPFLWAGAGDFDDRLHVLTGALACQAHHEESVGIADRHGFNCLIMLGLFFIMALLMVSRSYKKGPEDS
jgi:hypothetical protein